MDEPPWFKVRGYPHLDQRLRVDAAVKLVTAPERVASHAFLPFLEFEKVTKRYKPKERKVAEKPRLIRYAAHGDSHIFAYYSQVLGERLEVVLADLKCSECVVAYRAGCGTNADIANRAFQHIKRLAPCTVFAFDVEKFFDRIDHTLLKKRWARVLGSRHLPEDHYKIFKALTKSAHVRKSALLALLQIDPSDERTRVRLCSARDFRNRVRSAGIIVRNTSGRGIPQGSPISATLSNVYMIDFDVACQRMASSVGGQYLRYCDDILFILPSSNIPPDFEGIVESLLADEKLKSNDKTDVVTFDGSDPQGSAKHLEYLGFAFDGSRVYLRNRTLARFYRRMKGAVRRAVKSAKMHGDSRLAKRRIYRRFTHVGRQNFVRYALRSAQSLDGSRIRRQIKRHWKIIQDDIAHEWNG